MKWIIISVIAVGLGAMALSAQAHDTPNLEHTHAFQQTAYGSYRQGHYVSGPQGSIIIWSPQPYTGYQNAPNVRFARPEPITKAPSNPTPRPGAGQKPTLERGDKQQAG